MQKRGSEQKQPGRLPDRQPAEAIQRCSGHLTRQTTGWSASTLPGRLTRQEASRSNRALLRTLFLTSQGRCEGTEASQNRSISTKFLTPKTEGARTPKRGGGRFSLTPPPYPTGSRTEYVGNTGRHSPQAGGGAGTPKQCWSGSATQRRLPRQTARRITVVVPVAPFLTGRRRHGNPETRRGGRFGLTRPPYPTARGTEYYGHTGRHSHRPEDAGTPKRRGGRFGLDPPSHRTGGATTGGCPTDAPPASAVKSSRRRPDRPHRRCPGRYRNARSTPRRRQPSRSSWSCAACSYSRSRCPARWR